jgi:flagella basal body P-ring formation protein FlgA
VRTILRVRDDDLKIVWPDRHAEFLLQPVDGRTVHVQPVGTSERMPLSIRIYDGDRIVRTEIVRAEIRVRRTVRTASRVLTRGTRLAPDDFTTRDIWVGPGLDPATEVIGQVTARRLEPGTKIETTDIEPPLVIERGEQITLHCVSGAIAIRSPARALTDARDGEILTVEMSGTNKRVSARANGPGNAVLVVGTTPAETAQNSPKAPRKTAPSAGDRS